MCGIAGIVQFDRGPVDAALLDRMTDILRHRGPDGRGTVTLGSVGLGHRRLSIIDLAAGAQPMSTSDGCVWISFNGEIYNYRALRAEYRSRGYHFRTSSDTEVILAAYEADGIDCLRRLRGMFAFAIWDTRRQTLFLARDRLGIKPLVYSYRDGRLLFASELKALLQDPSTPRTLDWQALHDYLTLLYVPSPRTIFSAISKLEPGTYLQLSPDRDPTLHRYWTLEFAPDLSVQEERWVEGLSAQLQEAIQLHMVSDVPVGAFLSGGLDSSAVVAHMTALDGSRVRTFAVGFDDDAFNELDDARIVARHLGTEHHETIVKPDALEVLPSLAWQFDEPFADSSAIPTYYVARATRDHVTVALTGDGGDEAFAGYTRYARANRLHHLMDLSPLLLLRPFLRLAAGAVPRGMRGRGTLAMLGAPPLDRYMTMVTYQDQASLTRLLDRDARHTLAHLPSSAYLHDRIRQLKAPDYISRLQALDFRTYLPEDILTKVDRTSMLVSLEARVPLLDHVLLEFLARAPASLKLRATQSKYLLRRAVAVRLPDHTLTRRKMGFALPLRDWLRRELYDFTRDLLLAGDAETRWLLNTPEVARLLEEHRTGRRNYTSQLWSLVVLEQWARQWLRHPSTEQRG